jgi:5-methylcytosine-specific restriction endonuclease McrA
MNKNLSRPGKINGNYKDGRTIIKHFCKCGNKICWITKFYGSGLCLKCSAKIRGEKSRGKCFIITINYCCIDCGGLICTGTALYGSGRCSKCDDKNRAIRVKGKNNPNYIDGRTPKVHKIRNSKKYINWRNKIFERDNYTCQECGQIGYKLHAHHIKSFSKFITLRFKLFNGITLCEICHSNIHPNLNSVKKENNERKNDHRNR